MDFMPIVILILAIIAIISIWSTVRRINNGTEQMAFGWEQRIRMSEARKTSEALNKLRNCGIKIFSLEQIEGELDKIFEKSREALGGKIK